MDTFSFLNGMGVVAASPESLQIVEPYSETFISQLNWFYQRFDASFRSLVSADSSQWGGLFLICGTFDIDANYPGIQLAYAEFVSRSPKLPSRVFEELAHRQVDPISIQTLRTNMLVQL